MNTSNPNPKQTNETIMDRFDAICNQNLPNLVEIVTDSIAISDLIQAIKSPNKHQGRCFAQQGGVPLIGWGSLAILIIKIVLNSRVILYFFSRCCGSDDKTAKNYAGMIKLAMTQLYLRWTE